ncbi:MAG: FHA domain-containing protein [Gemmataceae bacterium]|nr:FHA domain-containing protein [Gemmataceae bacterium]
MKVSLVVASGVHQGRVIAIVGPQFLVGRDPGCQLRPASQAVSKQHCAVVVRDGRVYLKDFGSTNGTVLNDAIVQGEERPLSNNDSLKIGPLDFTVRIEPAAAKADGTPLPDLNPEAAAALAAVKAAEAAGRADGDPTPMPASRPGAGSKTAPAVKPSGSKESPALKAGGSKEGPALAPPPAPARTPADEEHDRLAAMLLGLDDGEVPGGSTVIEMQAPVVADATPAAGPADPKKPAAPAAAKEDTSNAASEILRKYMRRPR